VMVDGTPVRSCAVAAADFDGADVRTVAALGPATGLGSLAAAFGIELAAR
jgi:aerobic-type carbon monoxide dehydrogenase small subunit (CoxS/CutS family)